MSGGALTDATHSYRSRLEWKGTTGDGYESYPREHLVTVPPAGTELRLSGDPAFRGDSELLNPEQLLLVAASSCQLLSFLAVTARARLAVVEYTDEAEALMPEDERPMRITRITLRPTITLAADVDGDRIRRYVELAHEQCFIANSLRSEIVLEPSLSTD